MHCPILRNRGDITNPIKAITVNIISVF